MQTFFFRFDDERLRWRVVITRTMDDVIYSLLQAKSEVKKVKWKVNRVICIATSKTKKMHITWSHNSTFEIPRYVYPLCVPLVKGCAHWVAIKSRQKWLCSIWIRSTLRPLCKSWTDRLDSWLVIGMYQPSYQSLLGVMARVISAPLCKVFVNPRKTISVELHLCDAGINFVVGIFMTYHYYFYGRTIELLRERTKELRTTVVKNELAHFPQDSRRRFPFKSVWLMTRWKKAAQFLL